MRAIWWVCAAPSNGSRIQRARLLNGDLLTSSPFSQSLESIRICAYYVKPGPPRKAITKPFSLFERTTHDRERSMKSMGQESSAKTLCGTQITPQRPDVGLKRI